MLRTRFREGRDRIPLRDRIKDLPLLLAGPILRHTESNSVTVWVALKEPRTVTLKVYATQANGSILRTLLLEGSRSTVPFGQHLHIVAVTAKPIRVKEWGSERVGELPSSIPFCLKPGEIYAYDLSFGSEEQNLAQALTGEQFPHVTVSYFEHQLPTFALPPEDLNDLRLAHGSCRKLHGGGTDALPLLDDFLEHYAYDPNARLHQVFFTGDQIYGDDVADPLLEVATEVGDTLLGWEEHLPLSQTSTTSYGYKKPCELKPGERTDVAQEYGGFTAMLLNTPEEAKSHLFSLGEYFATYLLLWSPILWPDSLPSGKDRFKNPKQINRWDAEARHLKDCISQLWKIRRAMANVPIYMICDDHDISDDWYLNRAWCIRVLSQPLGRRVVQNGLLAYAVFQAWGNTPEQFEEGKPGEKLLSAVTGWSASHGMDESAAEEIAKCLGIPPLEPQTNLPKFRLDEDVLILDREYPDGSLPLEWHYTVRSHKHEVIVLDTRTWRGYPQDEREKGEFPPPKSQAQTLTSTRAEGMNRGAYKPPMLLCPQAFKQQIQKPLELTDQLKQTGKSNIEVTFVVLPTNLVSLRVIDMVQRWELEKGNVFNSDVGDAWNLNEVALSRLLIELFQKRRVVVVLTGDIHYAATVRLSYWFNPHQKETKDWGRGGQGGQEGNFTHISQQTAPLFPPSPLSSLSPTSIGSNARVLVQLTASAFKNGELKTYLIHSKAKCLMPELPQDWVGWHSPPQLIELQITPEKVRRMDVAVPPNGPVLKQIQGVRGNWGVAWAIIPKDLQSLPDWQYHLEWMKRQKAKLAPWIGKQVSSAASSNHAVRGFVALGKLVSKLWRNQWIQEGEEVVGRNNFGVVRLQWSQNQEEAKAVIQDNYWQPPWEPTRVVYSRYFVPLPFSNPPPILKAVSTSGLLHDELGE